MTDSPAFGAFGVAAEELVAGRLGRAATGAVSLALQSGEALLVTGPNGAGKSTLLRTLAGLLPPVAGAVRVTGLRGADGEPEPHLGRAAHYLGHRNALKPGLTLCQNLLFWQRFLGASGLDPAAALEAVGLRRLGDIPAGRVSAGQGRRVAIARLLVSRRPVWILDEPTASLDAASEASVAALIEAHRAQGGLVVVATHQPLALVGARRLDLRHAPPAAGGASRRTGGAAIDEAALAEAEGWL